MAGPAARARFWSTEAREIACCRSAGGTSSGWSVCQVGEVRAWPVPTAKIKASSTHGVTRFFMASSPRARRGDEHDNLRDEQEPAPVHQVADRARGDGEQDDRQARGSLHETDVCCRTGQGQHEPLGPDRLHPLPMLPTNCAAPGRCNTPSKRRWPGQCLSSPWRRRSGPGISGAGQPNSNGLSQPQPPMRTTYTCAAHNLRKLRVPG